MTRGSKDLGDKITVSTVAGASHKSYPLAPIPNNYSYEDVSDQPEAQPNQPLAWPLSFHGGLAYSHYDPQQAGAFVNTGMLIHEPNTIRAPLRFGGALLSGAANPPQYFFETDVNDSGADDGRPRLYVIAPEAAEINCYKLSLAYGYTATGAGVTTDTTAKTLTDARAAWTTSEWIGEVVTCNSQTLTITSNTATVLTGSGGWSADPGDGNAYKIGVGDFGTLLNTKTFAVTPTQPMGKPAEWNDGTNTYWRLGTGDTGNLLDSLTSITSGTTADTWSGGGDADARHLQKFGNQLARSTGTNEICLLDQGGNPETEASWGDEFYVGGKETNITELGEASGSLYMAKEDGFYEWDGSEGQASNILPLIGNAPRNGQGMVYWHGGFLVPTASGLWWTRTGKPVGPDSNPNNQANHPSLGNALYTKHGRWMGLATFGAYVYGLYVSSQGTTALLMYGRERDKADPPGWGPIIWHALDAAQADLSDFHGITITETSEFSLTETRPVLWYATENSIRYIILDKDGGPGNRRGDIDLASSAVLNSGTLDFGLPRVVKQLRVIEGWAEDMAAAGNAFSFNVYRDGGTAEAVGSSITEDGFFERFWTQDSNDTARSTIVRTIWAGTGSLTSQNGPRLSNVSVRAVALPDTTRVWTLFLTAEDKPGKTGKLVRAELEGYKNDLEKWELPDGDSFNGVLTKLRLLRADEVKNLTPRNQDPPHYVVEATVREMISS